MRKPLSIGLNCALGARDEAAILKNYQNSPPAIRRPTRMPALPNAFGEYDEQPADTAHIIEEWAREGR